MLQPPTSRSSRFAGSVFSAVALLLVTAASTGVAAAPQQEMVFKLATERSMSIDGAVSARTTIYDEVQRRWVPLQEATHNPFAAAPGAELIRASADELPYQRLLVQQTVRTQKAGQRAQPWTPLLKSWLPWITTTMNRYFDRRRGNPRIPQMDGPQGNKQVAWKQLAVGREKEESDQMNFNGRHDLTLLNNNDNMFGRGTAEVPNPVVSGVRLDTISCVINQGTGIECERRNTEGDVHFATRQILANGSVWPGFFEDLTINRRRVFLLSQLLFIVGHDPDLWVHDYNG